MGTRFPLQAQRNRENKRKQEKQKARTASSFSCLPPHLLFLLLSLRRGGKFGWRASQRKKRELGRKEGIGRASAEVVVQRLSASECLTYNILDAEEIISFAKN